MARTIFNTFAFLCSAFVVLAHVSGNNLGDKRKEFNSFIDEVTDEFVVYSHNDIKSRVDLLEVTINVIKGLDTEQGQAAEKLLTGAKSLKAEEEGYEKFIKAVGEKAKTPEGEEKAEGYEEARKAYPDLYRKAFDELATIKNGISDIFVFKTKDDESKDIILTAIYALNRLHKYKNSLGLLKLIMKKSGKYVSEINEYYNYKVLSAELRVYKLIPELKEAIKIGESHEATVAALESVLEPMPEIDGIMKKVNCLLLSKKYRASKKYYMVDGKNKAHQVVEVIEFITTHVVAEDRPEQIGAICAAAISGFSASSVLAVFGAAAALVSFAL